MITKNKTKKSYITSIVKKSKFPKNNKKRVVVTIQEPELVQIKAKRGRKKKVVDSAIPVKQTESVLEIPTIDDSVDKKVKKPVVMYFTDDTEKAVIEYNLSEDQDIRNFIYENRLKFSFEKLVENIFNTFKFTYFETSPIEIQKETVAHLVANISKYNPEKGKAFSYFSIIAKHYLIFHNNNNYKRFNQNVDISDTPSETSVCLQVEDPYYKNVEMGEFINIMILYWETHIGKIFTKQKDLNIANAVIELFRNSDRIDAFNKKALYLYIREISSCKTQQITKVINKMKGYQSNITKAYVKNGKFQKSI